jgi:hypothetical protein
MDMTENDPGGLNCVTPAYFDPDMAAAGIRVDDQGRLPRGADPDGVLPCTPGGYCAYFDILQPDRGWQQAGAAKRLLAPHSRLARKLRRLEPHIMHVAARRIAAEFDSSDVTPTDHPKRIDPNPVDSGNDPMGGAGFG